jgi:CRP-like cAMP-binding protein
VTSAPGRIFGLEPGEGRTAGLMALHSFAMGLSTVFFETAASALFVSRFGAPALPWVYVAAAFVNTGAGALFEAARARLAFRRLMAALLVFLFLSVAALRVGLALTEAAAAVFFLLVFYRVLSALTDLEYWAVAGQLYDVRMFEEASEEVLAEVAAILEEVEVAAAEPVFAKGDAGDSMYIIAEGRLRVCDGERTVGELGPGEVFGELALLDPEPRLFTVAALEDSRLLRLDREAFLELMAGNIEIVRGVLHVLCERLRRAESGDREPSPPDAVVGQVEGSGQLQERAADAGGGDGSRVAGRPGGKPLSSRGAVLGAPDPRQTVPVAGVDRAGGHRQEGPQKRVTANVLQAARQHPRAAVDGPPEAAGVGRVHEQREVHPRPQRRRLRGEGRERPLDDHQGGVELRLVGGRGDTVPRVRHARGRRMPVLEPLAVGGAAGERLERGQDPLRLG